MTEEQQRIERAIELACRYGGTDLVNLYGHFLSLISHKVYLYAQDSN